MKKVYCLYSAILLIYMENKKSSACLNEQVESLPNIPIRLPSESSNYWSGGSDPVLSDDGLEQQWYRVIHDGYQYLMVDSNNKPDQQYCSTFYPVYLQAFKLCIPFIIIPCIDDQTICNWTSEVPSFDGCPIDTGNHPSFESLTETAQSFVACRRNYFYPCSVSYAIKIRRCGTEVQYYLPPTDSYTAFCFKVGEKVLSTEIKTTTVQQNSDTNTPTYTTYPATTMLASEQSTSPTRQITREQTTVQTTNRPTTTATDYVRTDTISTYIQQTSSEQNIQTSEIPRKSTTSYYITHVASTSKSSQVPREQTTETIQSTRIHSPTTNYETHYTSTLKTIDATTNERRTSHRETWEPETTNTITSEPGTQPEFPLHHSTSNKNDDTTSGSNLGTTAKQYVEVDVNTSKIIIILTVCIGMLVVAVIVLVVVIVCRKRKASLKETEENNACAENKADNDHKYDNPTNIYHTVAERGSVANPYESLRDQNVRELEMSKSEYDVLTPDVNYQTLDYDRMPMKDEHLYQTLP